MQALVLLREPGVKSISNGTENYVFGEEVLKHRYKLTLLMPKGRGFLGD